MQKKQIESIPRMAVDIYCITHPKGEEHAREVVRRLVLAGRLKIVDNPTDRQGQ